jgi:hypothetical protein
MDYKVAAYGNMLAFTVTVATKLGSPVTGWGFLVLQVFTAGGEKRKILCDSYDRFNGSYSIVRMHMNPIVTDCMCV